ncbi:MAG: hypothetical protein ABUT20_00485 [Bacteroidota bacterium]
MDTFSRIRFLFAKYLERQCSADEIEELMALLQQAESEEALSEEMQLLWEEVRKNKIQYNIEWDKMYSSIVSSGEHTEVIIKKATEGKSSRYYVIATFFIIIFCLLFYWLIRHFQIIK